MSARRVLVLCYFYPPLGGGGVHRVLGFTRHLPEHGWACTVVCAGTEDYWVKDETLAARVPPGTEVIRVSGGGPWDWLRGSRSGAGRRSGGAFGLLRRWSDLALLPDPYVGWARRAAHAARQRLGRGDVDVVLSSSPPDSVHLAARDALRGRRIPWVADFRDPWVGLHFRRPPTEWHRRRQQALEREVLLRADRVLAASRTHAAELASTLGDGHADRIAHLPNGYEPDPPAGPAEDQADRFVIVFTGTLAQMPDAEVLLEAVHDVLAHRGEARRRLRVRIAGPYESGYEDRSIALGLKGIVEFLGPVPHARARALQRRADLLVLWKPRGPGYRTMVPGKLYEYLEAGRPLAALLEETDEAAALVREAGGVVLPPGRRDALAAQIERRYEAWRAGERAPDHRPAWLAEHARPRLAGRLAELLESARAGRP